MADLVQGHSLAPANGTWERTRLQELLDFITSEIHGGSAQLFNAGIPEAIKDIFRKKLCKRLEYLNAGWGSRINCWAPSPSLTPICSRY